MTDHLGFIVRWLIRAWVSRKQSESVAMESAGILRRRMRVLVGAPWTRIASLTATGSVIGGSYGTVMGAKARSRDVTTNALTSRRSNGLGRSKGISLFAGSDVHAPICAGSGACFSFCAGRERRDPVGRAHDFTLLSSFSSTAASFPFWIRAPWTISLFLWFYEEKISTWIDLFMQYFFSCLFCPFFYVQVAGDSFFPDFSEKRQLFFGFFFVSASISSLTSLLFRNSRVLSPTENSRRQRGCHGAGVNADSTTPVHLPKTKKWH